MRSLERWLGEYGESHTHPKNVWLHELCVPLIVLSTAGLLFAIPVPTALKEPFPAFTWALPVMAAALLYYAALSLRLALGMLIVFAAIAWALAVASARPLALALASVAVFAVAWVGQFIGHAYEGQRPSFFKDLQFLLIGPLWVLAALYRRLGVRY